MADPGKQLGFPKSSEKSSPPPRSWQPNSENKGPAAYQATSRGKGKREIEKKPQGPSYDDYRKDLTGVANNRAQYEFEASTIYKNFNNHPERRNTAAKDIEELKRNAAAAPRYKAPR
ncbi:MAG: hypothetical protein C5B47_02705 [Verrucomicrobia bacterium]|nr:MAG: hypothetical protein C5B47_02705 [Verrucomicrobiota bacterium]